MMWYDDTMTWYLDWNTRMSWLKHKKCLDWNTRNFLIGTQEMSWLDHKKRFACERRNLEFIRTAIRTATFSKCNVAQELRRDSSCATLHFAVLVLTGVLYTFPGTFSKVQKPSSIDRSLIPDARCPMPMPDAKILARILVKRRVNPKITKNHF